MLTTENDGLEDKQRLNHQQVASAVRFPASSVPTMAVDSLCRDWVLSLGRSTGISLQPTAGSQAAPARDTWRRRFWPTATTGLLLSHSTQMFIYFTFFLVFCRCLPSSWTAPVQNVRIYLFTRAVGTLARLVVVPGSVERHELLARALAVVHFVAFFDVDFVQFDRTAGFAGHQDLRRHQLSCESNN